MAGHCACRSPCWNSPPTSKDEFAKTASIEDSSILISNPAVSSGFTPYYAIQMTKTCACKNPRQNPLPVKCANDKFIIDKPN